MLSQVQEVSKHLDGLTATAIERAQHNMEATRSQAVDRFMSRLRDQVVPVLTEAKDSLQRLNGAGTALWKESEAIFAGLENQLAFTTNESLAKALEDLEKNTTAHTAKTNETLQKLYQNFEKAAQDNANSLLASAGNEMASTLQERAAEVSREFATGLEGYTRSYLEAIGKSIAEIPQNMQGRSSQ
jgi:F0F1-type ATP synthase membrane subunit b/b'